MDSYWIMAALPPATGVLKRTEDRHTGNRHTEAEEGIGVMPPQAKGHHGWRGPRKPNEARIVPWSLQRERGPADTLISGFWPLDCERINSCCFEPPRLWSVSVTLLLYFLKGTL